MAMPAMRRRYTANDVRELTHEHRPWPRYELIDGELLVTPAPRLPHQMVCTELLMVLDPYLANTRIGVAMLSPSELELEPGTITQPDVFVLPAGQPIAGPIVQWSDIKSLLLAIEVLSPSSLRTDRITKRDFYLANGVAQYWIVDVDSRVVERWLPASETPALYRDAITWTPRDGEPLMVDLVALFARVHAKMGLLGL
jgi:Uma2 family endonuclease